jgi:hypothetical protein
VAAAEAAGIERAGARTQPQGADFDVAPTDANPLPMRAEAVELRPSPRFDSTAGLARLAVIPEDLDQSRAGWTSPVAIPRARLDRTRVWLIAIYAAAMLAAIATVLL